MAEDLKLLALDAEDLTMLSAYCQDAVLRVEDSIYNPSDKRLLLGINRFAWEAKPIRRFFKKQHERRRSVLQLDRISALRSRGFDREDKDAVLSILAITFHDRADDNPSGTVTVTFSGKAVLQADVECIEARLTDQGAAWGALAKPRHKG